MKEKNIKVLKVAPCEIPVVQILENDLTALQNAVSVDADYCSLIEVIDLDERTCLICNEEGKLIGLEPNRRFGDDILCGVFYVVGQDMRGNFISLSEKQIAQYSKMFANIDTFSDGEVENTIIVKFVEI